MKFKWVFFPSMWAVDIFVGGSGGKIKNNAPIAYNLFYLAWIYFVDKERPLLKESQGQQWRKELPTNAAQKGNYRYNYLIRFKYTFVWTTVTTPVMTVISRASF